jgi:hypothetical protein
MESELAGGLYLPRTVWLKKSFPLLVIELNIRVLKERMLVLAPSFHT